MIMLVSTRGENTLNSLSDSPFRISRLSPHALHRAGMATAVIRANGRKYLHTSVDIPEILVIEARKRDLKIGRIITQHLMQEFGISEEQL